MAKRFHALRIARRGLQPQAVEGPLVVLLNHPSWWDPLVSMVLLDLFPGRRHTAPIDATALRGYRFFERLGFFAVDPGTIRGAAAFLRTSLGILAEPATALWITGQGRFVDPRDRPVKLEAGVAHLSRRLGSPPDGGPVKGAIVPLALEYPFWEEKLPEALAFFGEPIAIAGGPATVAGWLALLEERLERAQDALAIPARARDAEAFDVVLAGRAGVGGVYDLWRRWKARLRGERFRAGHGELVGGGDSVGGGNLVGGEEVGREEVRPGREKDRGGVS